MSFNSKFLNSMLKLLFSDISILEFPSYCGRWRLGPQTTPSPQHLPSHALSLSLCLSLSRSSALPFFPRKFLFEPLCIIYIIIIFSCIYYSLLSFIIYSDSLPFLCSLFVLELTVVSFFHWLSFLPLKTLLVHTGLKLCDYMLPHGSFFIHCLGPCLPFQSKSLFFIFSLSFSPPFSLSLLSVRNVSRMCMASLCRGHARLLHIVPISVCVPPKPALSLIPLCEILPNWMLVLLNESNDLHLLFSLYIFYLCFFPRGLFQLFLKTLYGINFC